MGAGASIVGPGGQDNKIRAMLAIRAYNARKRGDIGTVSQQFSIYKRVDPCTGSAYLTKADIKTALALKETPHIEILLDRYIGGDSAMIDYDTFMEFISVGPKKRGRQQVGCSKSTTASHSVCDQCGSSAPTVVDGRSQTLLKSFSIASMSEVNTPPTYPGSPKRQSCPPPPPTEQQEPQPESVCLVELVDTPRSASEDVAALTSYKSRERFLQEGSREVGAPILPVWKKMETFTQERVVQYTTIDGEGRKQTLTEREKNVTSIVHMECKETGEFAHREVTEYETAETFNGEIVSSESGTEQYVHLRSLEDEYEHMESTLPERAKQNNTSSGGAAPDDGGTICGDPAEKGDEEEGLEGSWRATEEEQNTGEEYIEQNPNAPPIDEQPPFMSLQTKHLGDADLPNVMAQAQPMSPCS